MKLIYLYILQYKLRFPLSRQRHLSYIFSQGPTVDLGGEEKHASRSIEIRKMTSRLKTSEKKSRMQTSSFFRGPNVVCIHSHKPLLDF
jgi:hypothetical protein